MGIIIRDNIQYLITIGNYLVLLLVCIIITSALLDLIISDIGKYMGWVGLGTFPITLFVIFASVYAIGQYFLLRYVKTRIQPLLKNRFLKTLHLTIAISQLCLIAIIVVIIFQIVFYSIYSLILLKSIVYTSFLISGGLFGLLGVRLLLWERLNKNHVLASYGITMIALAITSINNIMYVMFQLRDQRDLEVVSPGLGPTMYAIVNSFTDESYLILTTISFVLTWIATLFLLHHYSKKIGRFIYWAMVLAPLAGFLLPFQYFIPDTIPDLLSYFYTSPSELDLVSSIVKSLIIPVGAVMFGIAFLTAGRRLSDLVFIRDYMYIAGFGIMLFFIVNNPTFLTVLTFPPFGLSTICLVGVSSYLLLIGIYSSSLSIASDAEMLKAVRRSLPAESNLLGMIGSAQQIQNIENRAISMTNHLSSKMMLDSGIQTSLNDEDIKEYLAEIMAEIKQKDESKVK